MRLGRERSDLVNYVIIVKYIGRIINSYVIINGAHLSKKGLFYKYGNGGSVTAGPLASLTCVAAPCSRASAIANILDIII